MLTVPTSGSHDCPRSPNPLSFQTLQSYKKAPASHRVRGEAPNISLLGGKCGGKGRVKGKASRIHSSRIESALVCVRWNARNHDLKLPESMRFVAVSVVMVAAFRNVNIGYLVSPSLLSPQNIQSHETFPASPGPGVKQKLLVLRWARTVRARRESSVKSRIQSTRIGSALVCLRRNATHLELSVPDYTRFVVITVVMVAVSTSGPTGCLVSPPPLSSQNMLNGFDSKMRTD